ncbi:MAG: 3-hydroxyacyl-CoA dehydrogenase NAD-binding domain-containing protein [Pseudomonadota bacterium]
MAVEINIHDAVLVARFDNPPVNALSASVRKGLEKALDQAEESPSVRVVVITGGDGKAFSGGADIREFGKPPEAPLLPDLLRRIASFPKPVFAAVNGFALGGGFELALACHHRIAGPNASFGLPEVRLGLIPGAGGTQRLPRIVGIEMALEVILKGKTLSSEKAAKYDLAARLDGDENITAAAIRRINANDDFGDGTATSSAPYAASSDEIALLDAEEKKALARGRLCELNAVRAIRAAATEELNQGLLSERELFVECLKSPQRKAMIHGFFAERAAAKHAVFEGVAPKTITRVAILGAGTMGRGIAIACADAGYKVSIFDTSGKALDALSQAIKSHYDRQMKKGRITEDQAASLISAITPVENIDELAPAELFIEAVIEDMDIKKEVFKKLDAIAKQDAILASNTSYLDINEIAKATKRPEAVIGMHFFSPANIMRLLEIIKTDKAAPWTLATAFAMGKRLKKTSVLAGVCDGFIGNRIFKKYRQEAEYIVEDGALPQDVDRVMREFGFAMGPFEVSDLAGLDIGWHTRRREDATRDPDDRYVGIADRLYELGRLGQKSGAGWYRYDGRTAHPDPIVKDLVVTASREKGIERREVSDQEIKDRLLLCMANEGAWILDDGIAARASDIDIVFLKGYGFPGYRGGPMFYADEIGLSKVVDRMQELLDQGVCSWRMSPLLKRLASESSAFAAV